MLILITCLFSALAPSRMRANEKFLLSLYHFNIQYVAGGLMVQAAEGPIIFPGVGPSLPGFDLTEAQVEDLIVTESFEPVLDMYLRHSDWGADIEMQGYMVDILEKRHPKVLDKLRILAERGQIDIVSFHYSDQLFLAYPAQAMEWSVVLNKAVFEKFGIPVSPVVFTQEGQFGEGMLSFMTRHGYRIGLLPRNLLRYQHPTVADNPAPYYAKDGALVVVAGAGVNYNDGKIQVGWSFMSDGELMATNDLNPYAGPLFKYDPASVEEHETSIQERIDSGFKMSTVDGYVRRLQDLGIFPSTLPPILDGTWQPDDTGNLYLWMGRGGVFSDYEMDNSILTRNYQTYQNLRAIEAVFNARPELKGDAEGLLTIGALVEHLFAVVSDATGWNPWKGEVEYSRAHDQAARDYIEEVYKSLRKKSGGRTAIDTETGGFVDPEPPKQTSAEPPLNVQIESARERTTTWSRAEDETYELKIDFKEGAGRTAKVVFPLDFDRVVYSPALSEETLVDYPLSSFAFNDIAIPLSNGFIGLGVESSVIKVNTTVHVAAQISRVDRTVTFMDETAPAEAFIWRFLVVSGPHDVALSIANHVNVHPVVTFDTRRKKGGLCETVPAGTSSLLPPLLALLAYLRTRRSHIRGGHPCNRP